MTKTSLICFTVFVLYMFIMLKIEPVIAQITSPFYINVNEASLDETTSAGHVTVELHNGLGNPVVIQSIKLYLHESLMFSPRSIELTNEDTFSFSIEPNETRQEEIKIPKATIIQSLGDIIKYNCESRKARIIATYSTEVGGEAKEVYTTCNLNPRSPWWIVFLGAIIGVILGFFALLLLNKRNADAPKIKFLEYSLLGFVIVTIILIVSYYTKIALPGISINPTDFWSGIVLGIIFPNLIDGVSTFIDNKGIFKK